MEPEQIKQLLQYQSEAITEKPAKFPFAASDISMLPNGEEIKEITITPLKVGTVQRITPLLLKIEPEDLEAITTRENRKYESNAPELFKKYSDLILDITCIGIHNKKDEFPTWFKSFLKENCTWKDLHIFLNAILFRMGYKSFCNSTTTLVSVMGPMTEVEIIALRQNQESWQE